MDTLGERIKIAADEVGGLNRLANAIGVPRRTLGNWLSGTNPKPDALRKIAEATDTSLDWLVSGYGTPYDERLHRTLWRISPGNEGNKTHEELYAESSEFFRKGMERAQSELSGDFGPPDFMLPKEHVDEVEPIDPWVLERLYIAVEGVYREIGQSVTGNAIAREAAKLFNTLSKRVNLPNSTEQIVEAVIPILVNDLKSELLAAKPGTGKRSA